MIQLERQVVDAIDFEGMIRFLRRLIAVPSLDGNESPAQRLVAEQMQTCGLEVDQWSIDLDALRRHPAYCEEVVRTEALGVVGTTGRLDGAHSLILNGHVDVVPPGDLDQWDQSPWQARLTDRHVYGRGSADMKGGLCCALYAAKAIRDAGVDLASPLLVQSVIGEEDGGAGTLATLVRGHRASAAVIMEPTDLDVVTAQAGALNFRLRIAGKAAHGSLRREGVSAFEKFLPIHATLRALEDTRNSQVAHPLMADYDLPYPLSVGRLRAGGWPSTVPDQLCCEGRFGVALGETPDEARAVFESAVQRAASSDAWLARHPPTVEWWGGQFHPAETPTNHRLVGVLSDTVRDLTHREPKILGVPYGADMRLLVHEGGIPTVLFGPGSVRLAHQTNERISLDDLQLAVKTLAIAAIRYCGTVRSDGVKWRER